MTDAYHLLQDGLQHLDSGELDEAQKALEEAITLEPGQSSIYEALGRVYFSLRKYKQAAEAFQIILDMEPHEDYAHFCLGKCFDRLGNKDMALRHLKLATSLRPARTIYRRTLRKYEDKVEFLDGSSLDEEE